GVKYRSRARPPAVADPVRAARAQAGCAGAMSGGSSDDDTAARARARAAAVTATAARARAVAGAAAGTRAAARARARAVTGACGDEAAAAVGDLHAVVVAGRRGGHGQLAALVDRELDVARVVLVGAPALGARDAREGPAVEHAVVGEGRGQRDLAVGRIRRIQDARHGVVDQRVGRARRHLADRADGAGRGDLVDVVDVLGLDLDAVAAEQDDRADLPGARVVLHL